MSIWKTLSGAAALALAANMFSAAGRAQETTVHCDQGETIADALLNQGFTDVLIQGTCNESVDNGIDWVLRGDPNDGIDTIVGQVAVNSGHTGNILGGLHVSGSEGHGILVVENAALWIDGMTDLVTIENSAGNGVHLENGGTLRGNQILTQNNAGHGIFLDNGSIATLFGVTALGNGVTGITVFRGSQLDLGASRIEGSTEGISIHEHAAAWIHDTEISNTDPIEGALLVLRNSALQLRGNNTITSPGYAMSASNGASVNIRDDAKFSGIFQVDLLSAVDIRNATITGKVEVSDHSSLRVRNQAGPNHATIKGNVAVSRDSGVNFVKDGGEFRVKVVGSINCADGESSLGASSSTLVVTGKVNCTGY
jgi:hypothetical protein